MPQPSFETSRLELNQFQSAPDADLRGESQPYFSARPVTVLFEEQVAKRPHAPAIVFEDEQLTFRELNGQANQLATYLRELGVGRESLVGICTERSLKMAVAILGVLKAGAAYLPLDPDYPADRLSFMLADAAPAIVIKGQQAQPNPGGSADTVLLDRDWPAIAAKPRENVNHQTLPGDLAYVIYTSGSTGKPKGVMIEHGNLSNYLQALNHELNITPEDRYLHTASLAFSSARRQLLLPLSQGACVVIANTAQRKDPLALFRLVKESGVTVMDAVPSFWRNCTAILAELDESERRQLLDNWVRLMLSASEPMLADVPHRWMNDFSHPAHHVHMFGQTETAGIVCLYHVPRDVSGPSYLPIGNPIANTDLYILNGDQRACVAGEAGELYIGGAGVGRGYLNRPDLTAEKFFNFAGSRLYRTGDWARIGADGRVEFAGRRDQQVKLRGFRIELGEIEATLAQHPGVRECVVIARDNEPTDVRLLAYFVSNNDSLNPAELRKFLMERLPEYSIPSAFIQLEQLPLSANGKVNRLALPAPSSAKGSGAFVKPQTDFEERIAAIWSQVLRTDAVGREDNFYELGGHSLLAAQIVARVRRDLRINLPATLLLENPTVADFAAAANSYLYPAEVPVITRRARSETAPLSFSQQQFWLLDQSSERRSAYNVRTAIEITGRLDVEILERAIAAVVARHEILRTTFVEVNGSVMQLISDRLRVPLEIADLSDLAAPAARAEVARTLAEEADREFDLSRGPLIRARLLRLDPENHLLLFTLHHIICDGWSTGVLIRDLGTAYCGGRTDELPIQFADFAVWQRQQFTDEHLQPSLDYWKAQLAGAPAVLELPTDFPRPAIRTLDGGRVSTIVPVELAESLRRLAAGENATLFMTFLAAFEVLLSFYSGQTDVVVGSPVAGRDLTDTEGLIGAFVNTIVLRSDVSGNSTFREFLGRVRKTSLGALAHQSLPFEKLVEALRPPRQTNQTPLFQAMFSFQNLPAPQVLPNGVGFRPVKVGNNAAKFDLTLEVDETPNGLSFSFEYARDLFAHSTIERMSGHFRNLLNKVAANPEKLLSDLSLLTDEERHQLLDEWNNKQVDVPKDKCVHELFEAQVGRTPDAIAAEFQGDRLTYRDLNARANQLAHYLRTAGIGPESLVGISIDRSLDMLVAILGVLKAGGGYVPLDPHYPVDRLEFMIRDAGVRLVITQMHLADQLPPTVDLFVIDRDWPRIALEPDANPLNNANAGNVAYVIYTSGSTGKPKGVVVEHRSVVNFIVAATAAYQISGRDRVLQFASLSFDLSVEEIFPPLANGATLVLRTEDMITSPYDFFRFCNQWRITVLDLPTAYWHELTDALASDGVEVPSTVRLVILGGEKASADRLAAWHAVIKDRVRLVNTYGPTETTVAVTISDLTADKIVTSGVPIGRPFANTPVYVLDRALRPVPVGVIGELYIGGPGVARGYLNRSELTTEKFIRNPFITAGNGRLYRSGDIVRYRADGEIEFIGRLDNQVKIRGFRVELDEIEKAIRVHPGVKDCVVVFQEDEERLLAYVVPDDNESVAIRDLRLSVKATLPAYMIPASFERIAALPLMPNGKIDRKALPAPSGHGEAEDGFVAPSTPLEELLASAWREVLNVERIGIHDNFFDLGGHSLLAARAVSIIRSNLDVEMGMTDLFRSPTVAGLAEILYPAIAAHHDAVIDMAGILRELEDMSEEDVQRHLESQLQASEVTA